MGKNWDNSGVSFNPQTWQEVYRVLKPGGYLLAFGGSRTFHKIACAIEDAGFEIRDTIMWLFGSGFPKSMNISKALEAKEKLGNSGTRAKRQIEQACDTPLYNLKQTNNGAMGQVVETTRKTYVAGSELAKKWDGWGTCLKPAYEPIIVARKPFKGSLVDNVIQYGVGGLNIDECRVGDELIKGGTMPKMGEGAKGVCNYNTVGAARIEREDNNGRFPANVILTYDETDFEEVCGGFPNTNNDSSCRYFYCAKASKQDREEGLDDLENNVLRRVNSGGLENEPRFSPIVRKNSHPTVKPTSLMQYLIKLVAPSGATILDPFMGSGSTGKAAMSLDKEYKFIGIEKSKEYVNIAKNRILYFKDKNINTKNNKEEQYEQISMFDFVEK